MASEQNSSNTWINKMEAMLEQQGTPQRKGLTLNTLLRAIDNYDSLDHNDPETRRRVRKMILEASKKIIDRNRGAYGLTLPGKEGTKTRLKKINSYANQLSKMIEPVLLHIEETSYSRALVEEFMPSLEEAARFAPKLDPEMAARILMILDSAEVLGINFNSGLREVFNEIIEAQITPRSLDASRLLLDLAENRFQAGEYLTSYLLSREATRTIVEELTGVHTKELGSENAPTPDWRFEDYLGYLIEVGLVPAEEGKKFLDLFVGEPEHLNSRWNKRRQAEKALAEIKNYLENIDVDNAVNDEWL